MFHVAAYITSRLLGFHLIREMRDPLGLVIVRVTSCSILVTSAEPSPLENHAQAVVTDSLTCAVTELVDRFGMIPKVGISYGLDPPNT